MALVAIAGSVFACGDDAGKASCSGDACGACTTCDTSCGDACGEPEVAELGVSTALVMPDGRLAIATYDQNRGALVVIFQRPGETARVVREVSAGSSELGRWARIALESTGGLQVVWFDPVVGAILWTHGDDQGFSAPTRVREVIASHLALAVDASDKPHIAYRDDAARAVRYATRAGAGWTVVAIDGCAGEAGCPGADEDSGLGLDMALVSGAGSGALPRIAFYDALRGDLKLAGRDADGQWTTVTLDGRVNGVDTGDVGRFVSLSLTPTRSLGLAYYDATLGALRYLGPLGGARVIDSGFVMRDDGRARRLNVGQFCTLVYDSQGSAHILYVDSSTPKLRHARVPGESPAVVTELAIPAGAWPAFGVVGDRMLGAYGAFVAGQAPLTSLRLFDLPAGLATQGPR